ncbi:MAG: hypothetical protein MJ166_00185 [Clostridia bacterium]|nr:hypothetical protein [Clostridia bacterium]
MGRFNKRFLALGLTVIMLMSMLCSCDEVKKRKKTADEVVIEETEQFCEAMMTANAEVIESLALDDFEDESCSKVLKYYYNNPAWSNNQRNIADVILESLTYRVDKNSVLASYENKRGTIDVYFTHVDYETCLAENQHSSESDFDDILKTYKKTTYVKVTFDYVYEKHDWLIDDYEKVFIDVFTWKDYEYEFVYDFLSHINKIEVIPSTINTGDGYDYLNVSDFDIGIDTTNNFGEWEDCMMYLYKDGVEIEDAPVYYYHGGDYDYYTTYSADYALGQKYYPTGNYEAKFFDDLGNEVTSISFTIEYDSSQKVINKPADTKDFKYGNSPYLEEVSYAYWYKRDTSKDFELDLFLYSDFDGEFEYYYEIGDSEGDNIYYTSDYVEAYSSNQCLEITGDADYLPDDIDDITIYVYDDENRLIVKAYF